MNTVRLLMACAGVASLGAGAWAAPSNTTLPSGWSWLPVGSGMYDTGTQGTPRGGTDGQQNPPFTDTSFGVMNEPGTPWFTGTDLSAQQYIQRQIFGNLGTAGASGRFFNNGYAGTNPGENFPSFAAESRSVTLNHWNNPFPDAGGVAALGQIVYVPVSATLHLGSGWGGDEMLLTVIGGNSGGTSQFFVDATLTSSFNTSAFGGIISSGNEIRVNAVTEVNDAGSGNTYDVSWGYGVAFGGINQFRVGALDGVFVEGNYVTDPGQGIDANSVGYGFLKTYNVLGALVEDGSAFNIDFSSTAELINLVRDFGNADVRASMGPGMEGVARLVVEWQAFQAIPAPGAGALLALGMIVGTRRRR